MTDMQDQSPWLLPGIAIGVLGVACAIAAGVILIPVSKKPSPLTTPEPRETETLAAVAPPSSPPARRTFNHSFEITRRYDEFDDQTTVRVSLEKPRGDSFASSPSVELSLLTVFAGSSIARTPTEYVLSAVTFGQPEYRGHQLVVLADQSRFEVDATWEAMSDRRYWSGASLSAKQIAMILNSQRVRCRIGRVEFEFTDEQRAGMRDFVYRLDPELVK